MAQNTTIAVPAETWTLLTDSDVTSLTFQVRSNGPVYIAGTAGATPPTDFDGSIIFHSTQAQRNVSMSDMFPGISATRLYAYSKTVSNIFVSHA